MKNFPAIVLILIIASSVSRAQSDDSLKITWAGFVDTYFMYDFNNLPRHEPSHPFTTPSRHNEFNVNLAHIEVRASSQNIHGALALHTGTAVRTNYAAEVDNHELSQFIHEAWAGFQVVGGLWIDAGIYPAPYGFESWITRDNKTYTPSLVTNFCPFYETGIRANWQVTESFYAGVNVINGWQNIAETNNDKAVGFTLGFAPSEAISFSYNNFIGNEQPVGSPAALRFFNNLCTRITVSSDLQFDLTTDYGTQKKKEDKHSIWYGAALIGKGQLSEKFSIAGRIEYYKDEDQVLYVTASDNPYSNGVGFDGIGASLTANFQISRNLLWRAEFRTLKAKSPAFYSDKGLTDKDNFVVTSLALSL